MYPKKIDFSFNRDTYSFVLAMVFVYFIEILVAVPRLIELDYPSFFIWFKALDLLTAAIPPSLPAVLTSVMLFSIKKL